MNQGAPRGRGSTRSTNGHRTIALALIAALLAPTLVVTSAAEAGGRKFRDRHLRPAYAKPVLQARRSHVRAPLPIPVRMVPVSQSPLAVGDCNDNGISDAIEVPHDVAGTGGPVGPFGVNVTPMIVLEDPPAAAGPVMITVHAQGDIGMPDENITVLLNGVAVGTVFTGISNDCLDVMSTEQISVSPAQFNAARDAGPDIEVSLVSSSAVSASQCANASLMVDVLYLAAGITPDCNGNGAPDSCDFTQEWSMTSPTFEPIGNLNPAIWTLADLPPVLGPVTLDFTISGDYNAASEYVNVFINGMPIGKIFDFQAAYCEFSVDSITIPAEMLANAMSTGEVVIAMVSTQNVNPIVCEDYPSIIIATMTYEAPGESVDVDGDGVPDECDRVNCPADCSPMQPDGTVGDGTVGISDLFTVLDAVTVPNLNADISPINADGTFGNGEINMDDVIEVINAFGDC